MLKLQFNARKIIFTVLPLLPLLTTTPVQAFGTYQNGSGPNHQFANNHYYNITGIFYSNRPWTVDITDKYLAGDFKGDGKTELIGLNTETYPAAVMNQGISSPNTWEANTVRSLNHFFNGSIYNHLYTVGDFNGDGKDNVFKANANGQYKTYIYVQRPSLPVADLYLWGVLQSEINGNINVTDKLISGDFDGDGKSETMLIKPNNTHQTMKLVQTASDLWSWNVISQGNNSIAYWNTSWDDKFIVGDFNGNGRDEILAINPNGWHHTMAFNNGQWTMIEGDGSGIIGGANIDWNDNYISEDFNGDGRDEVILINSYHSWSLRLGFSNNTWSAIDHNQGDDYIGNWKNENNDHIISGDFNGDGQAELLQLNENNAWQLSTF
jgi:hypothetical protein